MWARCQSASAEGATPCAAFAAVHWPPCADSAFPHRAPSVRPEAAIPRLDQESAPCLCDRTRGLSTRLTGFSVSSPALTARLSTLESVKKSRKTVAALRPSFRRRAFHDSMRSTVMAVRGSGYQVLKSRCSFSSVLAAVRGRLALTHFVYVFAMNIPSVIASVPPMPCNGWRPCAKFPRTF